MRSHQAREYYDRRAPEYDDWYAGEGRFAARERPGWEDDVAALCAAIAALPAARTLDVACGTGFLTRWLPGSVVALDQSERMLSQAAGAAPSVELVKGDALELPFGDGSFDRVFTGHFYGHLDVDERARFLAEARRVGGELVVADSALRPGEPTEDASRRVLNDGSEWSVYKRWFTGAGLAEELGGGEILFDGRWFVLVRSAQ